MKKLLILLLAISSWATLPCRAKQHTHSRQTSKNAIKESIQSKKYLIGAGIVTTALLVCGGIYRYVYLEKAEEDVIYPKLSNTNRSLDDSKKDFEFKQLLVKELVSNIPRFTNSNGYLKSDLFVKGRVTYKVEVKKENSGSFGSVAFVTLHHCPEPSKKKFLAEFAVKTFHQVDEEAQMAEIDNLTMGNECPDIITFYGAFKLNGSWVVVMEKAANSLPVIPEEKEDFLDFEKHFPQIMNALAFIHSKGFVYMDPKPQNILIDKKGNARLGDLGAMKKAHLFDTSPNSMTPLYGSEAVAKGGAAIIWFASKRMQFLGKKKGIREELEKLLGGKITVYTPVEKLNAMIQRAPYNTSAIKFVENEKKIKNEYVNLAKKDPSSLQEQIKKLRLEYFPMNMLGDHPTPEMLEEHKLMTDFLISDLRSHDINGFGFVFSDQILIKKIGFQKLKNEVIQRLQNGLKGRVIHRQLLDKNKPIEAIVRQMLLPIPLPAAALLKKFRNSFNAQRSRHQEVLLSNP